jgi:hypothetical protein
VGQNHLLKSTLGSEQTVEMGVALTVVAVKDTWASAVTYVSV